MKSIFVLIATTLVLSSAAPSIAEAADSSDFGVGFILGSPTGLSAKVMLEDDRAFDLGLAFSSEDFILVWGDLHLQYPDLFGSRTAFLKDLTPYFGLGPVFAFSTRNDHGKDKYFKERNDTFALGVRVPFGIEWIGPAIPLGISFEIAPGIVILPATKALIDAGVAFRYYF